MDIQFPINLAYLSEYFDLEQLYNLTAQTFLDQPLEVMLPNLATADKLWDEVMAKEETAKFDMKEIINATKHSADVYDSLAHYLYTQTAVAHYKPTDDADNKLVRYTDNDRRANNFIGPPHTCEVPRYAITR